MASPMESDDEVIEQIPDEEMDCLVNDCECREYIRKMMQLKQGSYGMCWFVSVLNAIFISKGLRAVLHEYVNREFLLQACGEPDVVANHLINEVKGKTCLQPACTLDDIIGVGTAATKKILYEQMLQEYFSEAQNPFVFADDDHQTGGLPLRVICPYLVRLGYPACNIKHVVYTFSSLVRNKVDPRSVKVGRLCQDYLKYLHSCFENVDIFIFTMNQDMVSQLDDISKQNIALYMAKYLCFISGSQLHTYKLDCAFIASNNNSYRQSGHALCCVTCDDVGYILNSYHPKEGKHKTCSVYRHDWYKWPSNEYYYHTINSDNTCSQGEMIAASPGNESLFKTNDAHFTYHRNVGVNTFIYLRDIQDIHPNTSIENIHSGSDATMSTIKGMFDEHVKPYLYLLDGLARRDSVNGLHFQFDACFHFQEMTNVTVLQKGIVKPGMQVYSYTLTVPTNYIPQMIDLCQAVFPDDMMVVHNGFNPRLFMVVVQYVRMSWGSCPRYGGTKVQITR